jgi:transcriptional regulator with XRE-family HTH domain
MIGFMATTTTSARGRCLRRARERAGLTRAQLASLIGCSLAQLANIEQGAVPKHSRVLEAAFDTIKSLEDDDPATTPGRVKASAVQGPTNGT